MDGVVYRIWSDADGNLQAAGTPSSAFPPELEAIQVQAPEVSQQDTEGWSSPWSNRRYLRASLSSNHTIPIQTTRSLQQSQSSTVTSLNIMILWTPQAECHAAGLGDKCDRTASSTAQIQALTELAVQETNVALVESGVHIQLQLVYSNMTDYDEKKGWNRALSDLRSKQNGKMDEIHTLRDLYGAHFVHLIVSLPETYCGIGYFGPRPDLMFSVSDWTCTTGYYTLAHELGHNAGCHHNRDDSSYDLNYQHGYQDSRQRFRSILAYDCNKGCDRIQRFSNIEYGYDGMPVGNARHDNARQLNQVASEIASYYSTKTFCEWDDDCENIEDEVCNTEYGRGVCAPLPTPSPTMAPTQKATKPKPTAAPTSPTIAPTQKVKNPKPTTAPTGQVEYTTIYPAPPLPLSAYDSCSDDPAWSYGYGRHDCTWVASIPSRYCNLVGDDGSMANEGCKQTCGACTPSPSNAPSSSPSVAPSSIPSTQPSQYPTNLPSSNPSEAPTKAPSAAPSATPSISAAPSNEPSHRPSSDPSSVPSSIPSSIPSHTPSDVPSSIPSMSLEPTLSPQPSTSPSDAPSASPSVAPSASPSSVPSSLPSRIPSDAPSLVPTAFPTPQPSTAPSQEPSKVPSMAPSDGPSDIPSAEPTISISPSESPTMTPTTCQDSSQSFVVSDEVVDCGWVSRRINRRCVLSTDSGVPLHNKCPITCRTYCGIS